MAKYTNYARMLIRWAKMLSGRSYWHLQQGLGKAFVPKELKGYFNDLTGKTKWDGLVDSEGIPLNKLIDGSTCYFPTTIVQKALGHYDLYILNNEKRQFDDFLKICNWLFKTQDEHGGWKVGEILRFKGPSLYSAMTQGECISALVRAWKHTKDNKYMDSATKAYDLMIKPIELGGTAYHHDDGVYLEEYPSNGKNTVLNGWIFSLFGVYDFYLTTGEKSVQDIFENSFSTLKDNLHRFDAGFWSYYDEQRAMASPFYHNLHISQLEALFMVTKDNVIRQYIEKWKSYRQNFLKRNYAFILKVYQKLKKPPPVVIIK